MVANSDHVLFVDIQGALQLARGRWETIQNEVLCHAINPLSSGRDATSGEVSSGSFTGSKRPKAKKGSFTVNKRKILIIIGLSCRMPHLTICPCKFISATVLVLLQTTRQSGFFGVKWTLLMFIVVPAEAAPNDLKVLRHSVVFVFQSYYKKNQKNLKLKRNSFSWPHVRINILKRCWVH